MASIVHKQEIRGKRHHIVIRVTPKSAKGRAMLAKFKKEVKAFHARWERTFPKKKKNT
jgi:hypothetical protein